MRSEFYFSENTKMEEWGLEAFRAFLIPHPDFGGELKPYRPQEHSLNLWASYHLSQSSLPDLTLLLSPTEQNWMKHTGL